MWRSGISIARSDGSSVQENENEIANGDLEVCSRGGAERCYRAFSFIALERSLR
jgi:hypothetical protein